MIIENKFVTSARKNYMSSISYTEQICEEISVGAAARLGLFFHKADAAMNRQDSELREERLRAQCVEVPQKIAPKQRSQETSTPEMLQLLELLTKTSYKNGDSDSVSVLRCIAAQDIGLDVLLSYPRFSAGQGMTERKVYNMHLAAACGDVDVLGPISKAEALVDPIMDNQWTILHRAISNSYLEAIEALVKHGAIIDARADDNRTPLHLAADNGPYKEIEALVKHGATVDARADNDRTLLHWAAYKSHRKAIEALAKHGAAIDARTDKELDTSALCCRERSP